MGYDGFKRQEINSSLNEEVEVGASDLSEKEKLKNSANEAEETVIVSEEEDPLLWAKQACKVKSFSSSCLGSCRW